MATLRYFVTSFIWYVSIFILALLLTGQLNMTLLTVVILLLSPLLAARHFLSRRTARIQYTIPGAARKRTAIIINALLISGILTALIIFIIEMPKENFLFGGLLMLSIFLLVNGFIYMNKKWK